MQAGPQPPASLTSWCQLKSGWIAVAPGDYLDPSVEGATDSPKGTLPGDLGVETARERGRCTFCAGWNGVNGVGPSLDAEGLGSGRRRDRRPGWNLCLGLEQGLADSKLSLAAELLVRVSTIVFTSP